MDALSLLQPRPRSWLSRSVLRSSADAYARHLVDHGYPPIRVRTYTCCIAHFARWLSRRRVALRRIDESQVREFVFAHLPRCRCPQPVRRSRHEMHAALRHLLTVLRAQRRIARPRDSDPTCIRNELRAFSRHMEEVCGVAEATRLQRLKIVRAFLQDQFACSAIRLHTLKPRDIHRYIERAFRGLKPSSINVMCGILRSYLRFRTLCGEQLNELIAAIPRAASWRLAALPEVPSPQRLDALLGAIGRHNANGQRNYAIARCLVDLGLRAGEVARLRLDDFNWRDATLRIANSKSRRVDLLPLPAKTGQAIVDYLRKGRPATSTSRALFVRHIAPLDKPIGASIVRAAVRGAYLRSGWPYSQGTHVLRHSTASRLLQTGTPLKQIADILRHRSVDTTLIYTKVDINKLATVAMPWPRRRP